MAEVNEIFLKPYNPKTTEEKIYDVWEKSGFFNPDVCIQHNITNSDADYFSIVLPPPNVTGTLHLGHAFEDSIQDIAVRFARMQGKRTLWIPGTDHAAIATQSKVEKILQKEEGKNRHDLGREEFLKKVDSFAKASHDTIVSQIRRMGASLDWSREAFTLDAKRNFAVRTAFKKMYDDGIIYRGFRIINWDPKGQTTISDDEIVYEERKAILYTFKYSKDFPIAISTTRPETKVGDTAVAVHPDDTRYKEFVGKTYEVQDFLGEKLTIKVVADKEVDPEFGTGALGVTPSHSNIDWDIAERHSLPKKQVINEFAKMTVESPLLSGKKTAEAREIVANWLKENGLIIEEKEIDQNISTAERTGGIIEPIPKLQWFINVNKEFDFPHDSLPNIKKGEIVTLKKLMSTVVETATINIITDRFQKIYTNWIENLRDWCISRQLWYGHRIPVWYKKNNDAEEIYCGIEAPEGDDWIQDSDTLDTWFSSGLWTFSTLGWPEKTSDLERYHPTTFIDPGYEILFFWVARMILMSTFLLGEVPFRTVYLHGILRDKTGRKFSKSLNNGIDPIEMIEKYGADALRMALVVGVGPGNDSKFDEQKVKAYKLFANKIWNITRFVLSNKTLDISEINNQNITESLTESDKKKIEDFDKILSDITADMENYRFYMAAEKIYQYVWHNFADVIIEESKATIGSSSTQYMLYYILNSIIKILHPFMPFITEEIWSNIKNKEDNLLMVTKWPNL
jgi:valyl-tRNA synthetase